MCCSHPANPTELCCCCASLLQVGDPCDCSNCEGVCLCMSALSCECMVRAGQVCLGCSSETCPCQEHAACHSSSSGVCDHRHSNTPTILLHLQSSGPTSCSNVGQVQCGACGVCNSGACQDQVQKSPQGKAVGLRCVRGECTHASRHGAGPCNACTCVLVFTGETMRVPPVARCQSQPDDEPGWGTCPQGCTLTCPAASDCNGGKVCRTCGFINAVIDFGFCVVSSKMVKNVFVCFKSFSGMWDREPGRPWMYQPGCSLGCAPRWRLGAGPAAHVLVQRQRTTRPCAWPRLSACAAATTQPWQASPRFAGESASCCTARPAP